MSTPPSYFNWKQSEKHSLLSPCQVNALIKPLLNKVTSLRSHIEWLYYIVAEITDKLSHKKQKVKALHEATAWYKRLLSMRCEYSDGKYVTSNLPYLFLSKHASSDKVLLC